MADDTVFSFVLSILFSLVPPGGHPAGDELPSEVCAQMEPPEFFLNLG